MIQSWATALADFLMPAGCVACRSWIPAVGDARPLVCPSCKMRLRSPSWPRCVRCHHPLGTGRSDSADCLQCLDWPDALTRARSAVVLAPPADGLVHALKYEGWRELGGFMSDAMVEVARDVPADVVVPVPTTGSRRKKRGYNQAEVLAELVASAIGVQMVQALNRRRGEGSQTSLTPAERRANVRGAFVRGPGLGALLRGADVLLVDDVLTTGATGGEAATALAGAGAGTVTLVTYARALPSTALRAA